MAAAISTYLANKILDHTLKNTSYSPPATVYLGLYTSNPNNDNSGTEVSGNNYSRTSISFSSASGKTTSNSAPVVTASASGSWGTVTHFGILDAASSGNLLYYGSFASSNLVSSGQAVCIALGDLDITLV